MTPPKSPLDGKTYEEVEAAFREKLNGRIVAGYFFGSFAERTMTSRSDIDIMLVVNTQKRFFARYDDFGDLWDIYTPLDLLIYTPEEFSEKMAGSHVGFWRYAKKQLKSIL